MCRSGANVASRDADDKLDLLMTSISYQMVDFRPSLGRTRVLTGLLMLIVLHGAYSISI